MEKVVRVCSRPPQWTMTCLARLAISLKVGAYIGTPGTSFSKKSWGSRKLGSYSSIAASVARTMSKPKLYL